jgi:hypothetical protein
MDGVRVSLIPLDSLLEKGLALASTEVYGMIVHRARPFVGLMVTFHEGM